MSEWAAENIVIAEINLIMKWQLISLISQCHRAALLNDVRIDILLYRKTNRTIKLTIHFTWRTKTNPITLYWSSVFTVTQVLIRGFAVCDAVLLDECLPKFWGNTVSSFFHAEAIRSVQFKFVEFLYNFGKVHHRQLLVQTSWWWTIICCKHVESNLIGINQLISKILRLVGLSLSLTQCVSRCTDHTMYSLSSLHWPPAQEKARTTFKL